MNDNERSVLDLHDIALLLNYERGISEPRFRHTKLYEVAADGAEIQSMDVSDVPEWLDATVPKTGFVFVDNPEVFSEGQEEEPDLPENMLPQPVPARLQHLTPEDIELYYWQVRNHDGCYKSVTLFQHFVDLFPSDTRIRVRVLDNGNNLTAYETKAEDRRIIEVNLQQPKRMNVSFAKNRIYISGSTPTIPHAFLVFPGGSPENAVLDLSSLQFGNAGRGFKGKGTFVLELEGDYMDRLNTFADSNDYAKCSKRINATPFDDWLKKVACIAKKRWEKRSTEPWCAHCGAPSRSRAIPLPRCSKCKETHYCSTAHQNAAWPYHKHFCVAKKGEEK